MPERADWDSSSLYVVLLVSLLHLAWAVLLAVSPQAGHPTPIQPVQAVCGGRAGAIAALTASAVLALTAAVLHRRKVIVATIRERLLALALIPQQFLLLVSAGGGVTAAALGHYADGTVRPWEFILGDQLPVILVAFLYTTAILALGRARTE